MAVRLFIGNLSYDVTEAELRVHFAALGPLSALSLPMDRDTGKPRGFAFVEFRERTDAEEAIRRFNTQLFKGRPLAVSEALVRDDLASITANQQRHDVSLGTDLAGNELTPRPYGGTVLVAGTSGAGKSTFTTAVLERLVEKAYQLCIVDPEADYEHFAHAVVLVEPGSVR